MKDIKPYIDLEQIKKYIIVMLIFSFIKIAYLSQLIILGCWFFVMQSLFNLDNNKRSHFFVTAMYSVIFYLFIQLFNFIILILSSFNKSLLAMQNNIILLSAYILLPPLFFVTFSYSMQKDFLKGFSDIKYSNSWENCVIIIVIFQGIAILGQLFLNLKSLNLIVAKTVGLSEVKSLFFAGVFVQILYVIPIIYLILNLRQTIDAFKSQSVL